MKNENIYGARFRRKGKAPKNGWGTLPSSNTVANRKGGRKILRACL